MTFTPNTRKSLEIAELKVEPLEIELTEPFGIATGAQHRADNVLVHVRLSDGSIGLGEAAPFPAVNGETQGGVLDALSGFVDSWLGKSAREWRNRCREASEALSATPSAVCALESALVDAWLRSHQLSMWAFFGGSEATLESDITIPTGSPEQAASSALRAQQLGFRVLKVKVGAGSFDEDVVRLRQIVRSAVDCRLVLDANAGFSAHECLELMKALGPIRKKVALFEQPTPKDDLDAMRKVMVDAKVAVAADESARSPADVIEIARARAANVINIKLTKSGLGGALEMIQLAKSHELGLMVGGMVESQLCMSVSACVAAGVGGFTWVDLDTPLFMKAAPFEGGFERRGARLSVDTIDCGHGVRWLPRGAP